MKRLGFLLAGMLGTLLMVWTVGVVSQTGPAWAASGPNNAVNADYSGVPPFVAAVVTPNVLIMLDNSGSMGYRAYCDGTTNDFFTISSITRVGTTATVTYAKGHGWSGVAGSATMPLTVTVSGVTTSTASNAFYNGTFTPVFVSTTKIKYTMTGTPGSTPAPGNPQLVIASGPPTTPLQAIGDPAPAVYSQCPTATAVYGASAAGNDGAPFIETVTFGGLFDSLSCYTYSVSNTRFDVTSAKATISAACGATEWDGNLLNWATFRRQDALKKALMGGECFVTRLADGTCPPTGSPAKITLKGASGALSTCCDNSSTADVPRGVGTKHANGRVPTAVQARVALLTGTPNSVVFHLMATTAMTSGGFCVGGEKAAAPTTSTTTCGVFAGSPTSAVPSPATADWAANGEFMVRLSVATEPTGVIQDLGDKARFGLLEFRASGDGGKVLVPIGSFQATDYSATTVTNFTTNKSAMIGAIEGTRAATSTPLAETLYTGIKYVGQLTQPFAATTSYLYPCAFSSCGPSFGAAQTAGGLGTTESNLLAGGDACPTGLGYITGACARDPYFFGTNPAWVSPGSPKQVPCCKTFIMFLTDGEPTADSSTELDKFIYPAATATAIHGVDCTGDYTGAPATLTSSATDQAAYVATSGCFTNVSVDPAGTGLVANTIAPLTLLKKHKNDIGRNHFLDEVSYWGHTTDLRQATVKYPNGTTEAGHDLSGFQNVTIYPVFAFGNISGRDILMSSAKNGGFDDSNGNSLPDLQTEFDKTDNVTGLLVPDGIPDTYFESQNADDMKDKLLAALTSILQKAASGTSVSVLATSSTGEGAIFQAYFFPTTFVTIGGASTQVLWTGFAQGLFIDKFGNLREDYSTSNATGIPSTSCTGAPDGKLVLTTDCIIKIRLDTNPLSVTFGQVLIDRFTDDGLHCSPAPCAAGDGIADQTTPFATVTLTTGGISNVQPIWEAGRQLALLDPGASCESQSTDWPKTGNLTESGRLCRRILTWADRSGGFGISSDELLEVSTANNATLCPYFGGTLVLFCTDSALITAADVAPVGNVFTANGCAVGTARNTCALNEASNIINFVRGFNVTGLRDRTFNVINTSGAQVQKVWKLGDIINSTPIVVGAPKERYDVIYGDATYASYFQRYKDRRQVAYVGANDGMLHAFNAGFFTSDDAAIDGTGPTVQVRFSTTPKVKGSATTCTKLPCDAAVAQYDFRSDAPALGAELWGYIPQDLLPQLRWMTGTAYDHVYYVDLKPKITDARIFTADADHPGGWGTILIGGFRMGASCSNCGTKGTPRVVKADFNGNGVTTDSGDTRVFLSAYFVLDITNPEKEPDLLWTFKDKDLGLTTAAPAVLRVSPLTDSFGNPQSRTDPTGEKWYVVFGSGPTHHDGFSGQTGRVYAVDLKNGPVGAMESKNRTSGTSGDGTACSTTLPCIAVNNTSTVRTFSTGSPGSFMGDVVGLDSDLDFRVDTLYAGFTRCNGTATSSACSIAVPQWTGAMWRLTTNGGDTNPDNWGIAAGTSPCPAGSLRCPTKLLSALKASVCTAAVTSFTGGATGCNVGPVTSAAALTSDDTKNIWILFGTGRFFSSTDKSNVDIQHYYGVKDSFLTGGSPAQTTERNNLFNSSNLILCADCAPDANVSSTGDPTSFTTSFETGPSSLMAQILNVDGWFTTFSNPPDPLTPGERNLNPGTLVGGTLFFTTFTPVNDICTASGTGRLYAVFYQTGGPYKDSAVGTTTSGGHSLVKKSVTLGEGLPSQAAIQLGAQGSGASGAASSSGCSGRATIYIQSSTGVLGQNCGKTAKQAWSRMLSWRDL
nr:hypothetical protein [Nitrospirota bacterium]